MSRLWSFLAVALPVLGALVAGLPSVDLAYHLRAGAEILDTRAIPTADTWTFTAAGLPWTDQQWGAQVILAAVYQVAGWTGLGRPAGRADRRHLRLPVRDRVGVAASACGEPPG